eukprot:CAMPEP_0184528134 /NCGR_PEP_ID=MMETSP0198_2-20121128/11624_1 /TAXON_ID=1112570 /ORGANISM="Thraustochytrium sp., Strain LLF1b" /LENGTH=149 /DNA_ID=CAMNT_0026919949 /DNA_START=51 /DNA_END=500 /DNA_ORIENTATION=+
MMYTALMALMAAVAAAQETTEAPDATEAPTEEAVTELEAAQVPFYFVLLGVVFGVIIGVCAACFGPKLCKANPEDLEYYNEANKRVAQERSDNAKAEAKAEAKAKRKAERKAAKLAAKNDLENGAAVSPPDVETGVVSTDVASDTEEAK